MAARPDPEGDAARLLPPDLALLLDALRSEFNSKLSTLKLWGCLMCLCGGSLGGILAQFAPAQTHSALAFLGL